MLHGAHPELEDKETISSCKRQMAVYHSQKRIGAWWAETKRENSSNMTSHLGLEPPKPLLSLSFELLCMGMFENRHGPNLELLCAPILFFTSLHPLGPERAL